MPAPAAITISVPSPLRTYSEGAAELSTSAGSVRGALAWLAQRYPSLYRNVCDETGAVRRHINVFVNDAHMRDRQGLDTPLASGDVVTILPSVSGGS
jgi:molybdopterin converting factor small subunit